MPRPSRRHLALLLCLLGANGVGAISCGASCSGSCCDSCSARRRSPFRLQDVPNGVRHVAASAASGAIGVTCLAPVEVVRVNMLLNRDWSLQTAVASLQAGWFRGNMADVLAGAARIGVTMPAFALYKGLMRRALVRFGGAEPDERLPGWAIFAAGALAGCTASTFNYPLEVARTRAVACDLRLGVFGCITSVAREEGVLALYSGLLATLAGVLPFNAIKLSAYDLLRRQATAVAAASGDDASADRVSLPVPTVAAIGATSGVLAATSCFPLEVVRRRQMAGELTGLHPLAALTQLVRTEGKRVLFKGSGINCVKVSLANAIGFVMYELMKDVLMVDGRAPPWQKRAAA